MRTDPHAFYTQIIYAAPCAEENVAGLSRKLAQVIAKKKRDDAAGPATI
ncbi:hypothetical protein [Nitrososphaera sp.]